MGGAGERTILLIGRLKTPMSMTPAARSVRLISPFNMPP
jgi:hypothetical protein